MKNILTVLIILSSFVLFSQIKVNNVRDGYYQIYNADSIKIDQKSTELEAQQGLLNYQLSSGRKGYFVPPNFRIDISGSDIKGIEVDTLTISGRWYLTGESGNYFRLINNGDIIKIDTDSVVRSYQDIEVIRTKTFGKTEYKQTDNIPFQFTGYEITDITNTQVHFKTFATEKHCVTYYKDNVFYKEFQDICEPINSDRGWISGYYAHGMEPNTEYLIRVEGNTKDGKINFIEFIVKTL